MLTLLLITLLIVRQIWQPNKLVSITLIILSHWMMKFKGMTSDGGTFCFGSMFTLFKWHRPTNRHGSSSNKFFLQRLLHPTLIFCSRGRKESVTVFTCPTISPEVREAMYYSSTYTIALVGWLQMLEWPVEIEHEDPGITFLELYISFCCATGSRVPFNTADKKLKVQTYQAFESDLLVKSMPYPLHQQLRVFEFSLAYIVKLFGDQAFPIGRKANVSSLISDWFLGLQERGYVGDRSFHFVNGSSVIWRTLVFQI